MIVSQIFAFAWDQQGRRVIGKENKLPWYSPTDLKRFREYTDDHPVIMGRRTHEAIGKPLSNRINIVVSRDTEYISRGVHVVSSIEGALEKARTFGSHEIFIIGGAEIYKQTLKIADRLYMTEIKQGKFSGDTFFPDFRMDNFKRICLEDYTHETFSIYQRSSGTWADGDSYTEDTFDQSFAGLFI